MCTEPPGSSAGTVRKVRADRRPLKAPADRRPPPAASLERPGRLENARVLDGRCDQVATGRAGEHAVDRQVVALGGPGGEDDLVWAPGADELDQLCLDHIARYKRPKDYRFVGSLPTNNYGKVVKRELREMLAAEAGEV